VFVGVTHSICHWCRSCWVSVWTQISSVVVSNWPLSGSPWLW